VTDDGHVEPSSPIRPAERRRHDRAVLDRQLPLNDDVRSLHEAERIEQGTENLARAREGQVRDNRERRARPSPPACVGLDHGHFLAESVPELRSERAIELERNDLRPGSDEGAREGAGARADVHHELPWRDAGVANELRCELATAEEVLAGSARVLYASLPNGHGRPPSWSRVRFYARRPLCDSHGVFDHVTIRVSDREASERFYDTVLAMLGIEKTYADEQLVEWNDFSLMAAEEGTSPTRRLHAGFAAPSRAIVDEFGTEAGYRDDGAPGPRPQYTESYYGAFLLDPDGNSVEAVSYDYVRESGIDHLWIRVADVAAAKRFYELVAPFAGFKLRRDTPVRARFAGEDRSGSFSLVRGTPTGNVHLAFPVSDNRVVEDFHAALTAAGYRDNGTPGERPMYHPGYYGAYVLDPDGNNVELVNHNRG
jgi:catechol 2,3-dioxygenase-like lactoylglutathione lyase family enzyme